MSPAYALLKRDMTLAFRAGGGAMLAVAFFGTIAALVPLGVGADRALLGRIGGGVLWVAAALSALLVAAIPAVVAVATVDEDRKSPAAKEST